MLSHQADEPRAVAGRALAPMRGAYALRPPLSTRCAAGLPFRPCGAGIDRAPCLQDNQLGKPHHQHAVAAGQTEDLGFVDQIQRQDTMHRRRPQPHVVRLWRESASLRARAFARARLSACARARTCVCVCVCVCVTFRQIVLGSRAWVWG